MGYTTEFEGVFRLDKPLSLAHFRYLNAFAGTRRMLRDADATIKIPDPIREAVQLPVGTQGEFFVGASGFGGQDRDSSIVQYNTPPRTQPGLWCQWVPTEDGTGIEWDRGEKFYEYIEWLRYIISNFIAPWGYKLNGEVSWSGEDPEDIGKIQVTDNEVEVLRGTITYG